MKRKTLTILFVDLQGYTSRTASQTREENALLVQELKAFIQKHIAQYGGTFVKAMGDGFLVTFESPTDAIVCGQEMQVKIEQRNANVLNQDHFIRFRIGISTGEVNIDDDGDVYGDAVNIASRIQSFAEPNDVYISEATYLAMNRSEIHAMDLGPKMFKNALKEVRVYKVLKDAAEPTATPPPAKKNFPLSALLMTAGVLSVCGLLIYLGLSMRKPDIEKLFDKEDYGAVVELAHPLLEEDPENMRLHELMILSLIKLRDFPQLKIRLRNAREIFGNLSPLCPPTLEFLHQEGEHRIARTIERRHCSPQFQQQRDEPFFRDQQDDMKRPADHFRRDREDLRQNPDALFFEEQGPDFDRLLREENYDEIIRWGEQQLRRDPQDIGAREMMSEAFARMGDFDRAKQFLREAHDVMPEASHLLFRLAELNEETGEYPEAIRTFQEFARETDDVFQKREAFRRIEELKNRMRPEGRY